MKGDQVYIEFFGLRRKYNEWISSTSFRIALLDIGNFQALYDLEFDSIQLKSGNINRVSRKCPVDEVYFASNPSTFISKALPCGHNICRGCCVKLDKCPICGVLIELRVCLCIDG